MTAEMKDYWMRILAAFFLLKMASGLMRDAEKMMAQSLRAKDDAVTVSLNGNGTIVEAAETEPETEVASDDPEVTVDLENDDA